MTQHQFQNFTAKIQDAVNSERKNEKNDTQDSSETPTPQDKNSSYKRDAVQEHFDSDRKKATSPE